MLVFLGTIDVRVHSKDKEREREENASFSGNY